MGEKGTKTDLKNEELPKAPEVEELRATVRMKSRPEGSKIA